MSSPQFLRNNIRQQLKTILGKGRYLPSNRSKELLNLFPYISSFPEGMTQIEKQINFVASLVKWFQSFDSETLEILKSFVEVRGQSLELSNKLKASYRQFCNAEGISCAL